MVSSQSKIVAIVGSRVKIICLIVANIRNIEDNKTMSAIFLRVKYVFLTFLVPDVSRLVRNVSSTFINVRKTITLT